MELFPLYKIQHPYRVSSRIFYRKTLHKIWMSRHQADNTGFLHRAPHAIKNQRANARPEVLVKDQLYNLHATINKIDGALNPELWLLVNSEPALFLIVAHQVGSVPKEQHVPVIDTEEIRCVRVVSVIILGFFGRISAPNRDTTRSFSASCENRIL